MADSADATPAGASTAATDLTAAAAAQPDLAPLLQTVAAGGAAKDVDLAPLMKLLEKKPGDVAAWAVDQIKDLSEAETLVESLPIFQVAGAFKGAPIEQKEALVRSVMQGIGEMPAEKRTEAFRMVTELAPDIQNPESAASGSESNTPAAANTKATTSVLAANFAALAKEADLKEMKPEEVQRVQETVQQEQGALIQPLLDIVPELSEEEREKVTNTLVKTGVVPEEKRELLIEAIKPGGHADELVNLMKFMSFLKYWQVVWVVPVLEVAVVLYLAFGVEEGCSVPVTWWLTVDTILGFMLAIFASGVNSAIGPLIKKAAANPMGVATEVQTKVDGGTPPMQAIPGAESALYNFCGACGCIAIAVFLVIWGVIELIELLASGCSAIPKMSAIVFSICIMAFRIMLPAAVARKGVQLFFKYQKFQQQQRNGQSSASTPLTSDPDPVGYGSSDP